MAKGICPECGAANEATSNFCVACGAPLGTPDRRVPIRVRVWLYVAVAGVLALVGGLVGYTVFVPDSGGAFEIRPDRATIVAHETGVRLEVPEGAVSESITGTVTVVQNPPEADDDKLLVGEVYHIELDTPTIFLEPILLTIPYDPNRVPGGRDEGEVFVGFWVDGVWYPEYGTVDDEANSVTIETFHASEVVGMVHDTSGLLSSEEQDRLDALAQVRFVREGVFEVEGELAEACALSTESMMRSFDRVEEVTEQLEELFESLASLPIGIGAAEVERRLAAYDNLPGGISSMEKEDLLKLAQNYQDWRSDHAGPFGITARFGSKASFKIAKTFGPGTTEKSKLLFKSGRAVGYLGALYSWGQIIYFGSSVIAAEYFEYVWQTNCARAAEARCVANALRNPDWDIGVFCGDYVKAFIWSMGEPEYGSAEVANSFSGPTPPEEIERLTDMRTALLRLDQALQTRTLADWLSLTDPTVPYAQRLTLAENLQSGAMGHAFRCEGIVHGNSKPGEFAVVLYTATETSSGEETRFAIGVDSPPESSYYQVAPSLWLLTPPDLGVAGRFHNVTSCLPEMHRDPLIGTTPWFQFAQTQPSTHEAVVFPSLGPDQVRAVSVSGLTPGGRVGARMVTPDRDIVALPSGDADSSGNTGWLVSLTSDDQAGTYIVLATDRSTGQEARIEFIYEPAATTGLTATVSPSTGEASGRRIEVNGLTPNGTVNIRVVYEAATIAEWNATADTAGNFDDVYQVLSASPPGIYQVVITDVETDRSTTTGFVYEPADVASTTITVPGVTGTTVPGVTPGTTVTTQPLSTTTTTQPPPTTTTPSCPTVNPSLSISPVPPSQEGTVSFVAELNGFGSAVDLTVLDPLGDPFTQAGLFRLGFDGAGSYTYLVEVPADSMKGQYRLTATDRCSGESARAFFEI